MKGSWDRFRAGLRAKYNSYLSMTIISLWRSSKKATRDAVKPTHILKIRKLEPFHHGSIHAFPEGNIVQRAWTVCTCFMIGQMFNHRLSFCHNLLIEDFESCHTSPSRCAVALILAQNLECTILGPSDRRLCDLR